MAALAIAILPLLWLAIGLVLVAVRLSRTDAATAAAKAEPAA